MGSFSDVFENKILNHIFGKEDYTDNRWLYIALLLSELGDDATNETMEEHPDEAGYARLTTAETNWSTAANGIVTNSTALYFDQAIGDWAPVFYFAFMSSGVWGEGDVYMWGELAQAVQVLDTEVLTYSPGDFQITLD